VGRPGDPHRLRFRYAKLGKIRFTSQRDVARMWERALRRSGLPVAWSEGFSPRPLLSFGLALPTGAESLAEYLDARLELGISPATPPGPVA
jgi:radical SAM-linked protein